MKTAERWQSGSAAAIVLVTFAYTFFAYQQWCTMDAQLAQTDQNLKLTYRARLNFAPLPRRRPELTSDGLASWSVEYVNNGRGTATKIWHFALIATQSKAPPTLMPQLPWNAKDYTEQAQTFPVFPPLAPNGRDKMGLSPFLSKFELPTLRQSILDEHNVLTIQVMLFYTDEFGDPHQTSRCITYENEFLTSYCPQGNYDD